VVLGEGQMTRMDDQVAEHIKEMILRIKRKPTDNQEQPRKPHTLNEIIRTLRRGPDRIHGLVPPKCYPQEDNYPET
jgi:hypothetical protein